MLYKKKYSANILLYEVGERRGYCFTMSVPDPGFKILFINNQTGGCISL
jgi:hypothetical protein